MEVHKILGSECSLRKTASSETWAPTIFWAVRNICKTEKCKLGHRTYEGPEESWILKPFSTQETFANDFSIQPTFANDSTNFHFFLVLMNSCCPCYWFFHFIDVREITKIEETYKTNQITWTVLIQLCQFNYVSYAVPPTNSNWYRNTFARNHMGEKIVCQFYWIITY